PFHFEVFWQEQRHAVRVIAAIVDLPHDWIGGAGDQGKGAAHLSGLGVGGHQAVVMIKPRDTEHRPVFQADMVRYLVLPALDLAVLKDAGYRDQTALFSDPIPEGAPVYQDLFTTGIDHRLAH